MKILLIADDITLVGGAERVITTLANAFVDKDSKNNEIIIFSLHHKNKNLPYLLSQNVKVHYYPQATTKKEIKQIKSFYKRFAIKFKVVVFKLKFFFFHLRLLKTEEVLGRILSATINQHKSDIVLDNTGYSYYPFYKNKYTKYIMLMHISYCCKITYTNHEYFDRLKRYDTLIILSAAELDIWQRYHNNVRIIPNFLPQIPTQSTDYKQKVVLSVGRMDNGDQKGFLRLIDIWKMVQESIKNPPHPVILSETQCSEVSKPRESNKNDELRTEKRFDELDSTLQRSDSNSLDSRTLDSSLRATLCAQNDNLDLSQWKLIIVGDGILKDEIETKIKALNLQDSIILKPFTKEIEKEYLSASIYAMSSHFEGFPMVLIESTSYGLAPISFDIKTGPSDIIADNQSGFLVKDNDLQDYADKLITLMSDENLRANFGKKAKTLVSEKFSKEVVIKLWEKVFDEMKR